MRWKGDSNEIVKVLAYVVDIAKAEALDCLGDQPAVIKLAERYLVISNYVTPLLPRLTEGQNNRGLVAC